MIDTIALMSPTLSMNTMSLLEDKANCRMEIDMATGEQKIFNLYGQVSNELGIPIHYSIYRMDDGAKLRIEASIHKLLVGHNVYGGPKDFHASAAYLVGTFERLMGIKLPHFMDWNVQRVDVEEFYKLANSNQPEAWLHSIRNAYFPKRKSINYPYSVWIPGKTTVLKFYIKGKELCDKTKNTERKRLIQQIELTGFAKLVLIGYKIIKVEVEIKKEKLKYDHGRNTTVKDITNAYLLNVHDTEVNKFLKDSRGAIALVRYSDQVYERLRAFYKPVLAGILFEFWQDLSRKGEVKVRKSVAKSTYNKHLKELRNAGVDWKVNALSTPEYSAIPADFCPVRGNKYHLNDSLEKVELKLSPYLNKNST